MKAQRVALGYKKTSLSLLPNATLPAFKCPFQLLPVRPPQLSHPTLCPWASPGKKVQLQLFQGFQARPF